jgi:hypothetical protein
MTRPVGKQSLPFRYHRLRLADAVGSTALSPTSRTVVAAHRSSYKSIMVRKGPRVGASSSAASSAVPAFTSFAAATAAVLGPADGSAAAPASLSDWDSSALALVKATSKRDPTTRAKALSDLSALLDSGAPPRDEGKVFLSAWAAQFCALATADPAPVVRAAAVDVMARIVRVLGPRVKPVLREVVPAWVGALGDEAVAVRDAARNGLETAFGGRDGVKTGRLAEVCKEELVRYCIDGVDVVAVDAAVSADVAVATLRRVLAVARWAVDSAGSVEAMTPFLDDDILLRIGTGLKRKRIAGGAKSRGSSSPVVSTPREACSFAAECLVPGLGISNAHNEVGLARATRLADLAIACIRAGESAGWDLFLTLLSAGWALAFGDWDRARASFLAALFSPGRHALDALLPLFHLLPAEPASLITADAILAQLRASILPVPTGVDPETSAVEANGKPRAPPSAAFSIGFAMTALPAYLECLAYTARSGVAKWSPDDKTNVCAHFASDHVQPTITSYLTGVILPPARAHLSGTRSTASRTTAERPQQLLQIQHRSGKYGRVNELPLQFALAVLALEDTVDVDALLTKLIEDVIPLRASSQELACRLVNVAHGVQASDKPRAALFIRSLTSRLMMSAGGGGKYENDGKESELSPSETSCDAGKAVHLHALVGLSKISNLPVGVSVEDISAFALRIARSPMQDFDGGDTREELAGFLFSWVAQTSTEACSHVIASVLSSSSSPASLLAATLRAHSIRKVLLGTDDSNWYPLQSTHMDEFIVACADSLLEQEIQESDCCTLERDTKVTYISFLQAVLDPNGGCLLAHYEATFGHIVRVATLLVTKNELNLASAVLSIPASSIETVSGIVDLVATLVVQDGVTNSALLSYLPQLSEAQHCLYQDRVTAFIAKKLSIGDAALNDGVRVRNEINGNLDCERVVGAAILLGRAWVNFVTCLIPSSRKSSVHARVVQALEREMELATQSTGIVVANFFAASVLASAGLASVMGIDKTSRAADGQFCTRDEELAKVFVNEYERLISLDALVSDSSTGKAVRRLAIDLRKLFDGVIENHEMNNIAYSAVEVIVERVLHMSGRNDERERRLLWLHILQIIVGADNDSWQSVDRAAAAAMGDEVFLNSNVRCVVAVCSVQSGRQGIDAFRPLLEEAVRSIRRESESKEARCGLHLLAAALEPPASTLPQWLAESVTTVIRSIRRGRESSALAVQHQGTGILSLSALVLARAIACGYDLSGDDWRFWSLAALDMLREAQLHAVDADDSVLAEISSMAQLASVMVARMLRSPSPPEIAQAYSGASADEILYYGAWAGVKYLERFLSESDRNRDLQPLVFADGLVTLMTTAAHQGLLIREGEALPIAPDTVYASLVPLFTRNRADVRISVFSVVVSVAKDDLHRVVEASLPVDGYGDEREENLAMKELIPDVIRDSLSWSQDVHVSALDDEDASDSARWALHEELGYFMSWLLFLELTGEENGTCSSESEDRSFRRVAASYLRANEDLFSDFISHSIDIVINGNGAERASASACAITSLEHDRSVLDWMPSVEAAGSKSMDVLVGSYAGAAFAYCLQRLPAMSRQHVSERMERGPMMAVEDFVRKRISPLLIADEIRKVREWSAFGGGGGGGGGGGEEGELSARGSAAGREVWASYTLSDVTLEVSLRLPETFPLQTVEVIEDGAGGDGTCSRHVGMSRGAWRKTVIGMNTLLRFKDGSVAEAVEVWRRNLDKTFQGVEECPICYSVLHLATAALPKMQCRTCKNLFHSQCLCKWFTKSSSSACPMCRSAF